MDNESTLTAAYKDNLFEYIGRDVTKIIITFAWKSYRNLNRVNKYFYELCGDFAAFTHFCLYESQLFSYEAKLMNSLEIIRNNNFSKLDEIFTVRLFRFYLIFAAINEDIFKDVKIREKLESVLSNKEDILDKFHIEWIYIKIGNVISTSQNLGEFFVLFKLFNILEYVKREGISLGKIMTSEAIVFVNDAAIFTLVENNLKSSFLDRELEFIVEAAEKDQVSEEVMKAYFSSPRFLQEIDRRRIEYEDDKIYIWGLKYHPLKGKIKEAFLAAKHQISPQ